MSVSETKASKGKSEGKSSSVINPVPEKPKLGVTEVSTRALNSLPEGASYPEGEVVNPNVRKFLAKDQAKRRGKG